MIISQSQINSCGISVGPCTQRVDTGRFVIASSAVKRKQVWIRKYRLNTGNRLVGARLSAGNVKCQHDDRVTPR